MGRIVFCVFLLAGLSSCGNSGIDNSVKGAVEDGGSFETTLSPRQDEITIDTSVSQYADKYDLSEEEATQEVYMRSRLADFAEDQRQNQDSFAGFKVERDESGPVGVLALADAALEPDEIPDDVNVRVVATKFSIAEIENYWNQHSGDLQAIDSSIRQLTYDPFDELLLLWGMSDASERSENVERDTQELLEEGLGQKVTFEYREILKAEPA